MLSHAVSRRPYRLLRFGLVGFLACTHLGNLERAALQSHLPRPALRSPESTDDSEAQKAVQRLVDELLEGLPEGPDVSDDDARDRWLLAQLLSWHRREEKSFWWRYFYLRDLTDEERQEEPDALGCLHFLDSRPDPAPGARSTIYRFSFPPQEHKVSAGTTPHDPATGKAAGEAVFLDDAAGLIELKRGNNQPPPAPGSLIPYEHIDAGPKKESLQRLARWVIDSPSMGGPGPFRAGRDLLLRRPPNLDQPSGQPLARSGEGPQAAARRLVLNLNGSYLAIQGPPGSGKSSLGAQMIGDLVAAGLRVGVTANSHKVIAELLQKLPPSPREPPIDIGQRAGPADPVCPRSRRLATNQEARLALEDGSLQVAGGTTWLWAREEMQSSVDVLFIDEAGQMSLADALAASQCATSLVLLGDPQQLDQPLQGVHPPGADRSALAHLLGDYRVMPTTASSSTVPGVCIRTSPAIRPRSSMTVAFTPTGGGSG